MKKASYVLFALLGVFLALIVGIFIGRSSVTGMRVITETAVSQTQSDDQSLGLDTSSSQMVSAESKKIDINTASVSLLQTLPNIGQVLAQRIVDYREEHGSYTAPEDLLLVEGIGEKRLEELREYITVGG